MLTSVKNILYIDIISGDKASYLLGKYCFLSLLLLTSSFTLADKVKSVDEPSQLLEIYVRDGCPHCADAKDYLPNLAQLRPKLNIVIHSIDQDKVARDKLFKLSRKAGIWPPGVPSFVIDGRMMVGFNSADQTGPQLLAFIDGKTVLVDSGDEKTRPENSIPTEINSNIIGKISIESLGLPLFTLAIGLLDGFNPCALWVLLFLLSLLVHLRDRKKMALIATTFVVVSGTVYYVFLAAWLNIFIFVGISTTLIRLLGVIAILISGINLKDFFSKQSEFTLSIPDAEKPNIYARMRSIIKAGSLLPSLFGVIVLAIVVNFIELLCTAGFPAIYTAILTQQALTTAEYYGYLGLYILGYIADDALAVTFAVIALNSKKLTYKAGRWLKFISGAVMFLLGLMMIFKPAWLS
jgi:cytochrome c biogenesis protein CcdA/glutaredoxin